MDSILENGSTYEVEEENNPFVTTDFSKESFLNFWKKAYKKVTTKEGLIGDYDYKYLFTPSFPFHDLFYKKVLKREPITVEQPFFSLNSDIPVVLGLLLGFQHALAMLAGVMTPPIIIASAANFDTQLQEYLVSASLISSGILSFIQITRFHIYKTPYYIGSGILCVVGTSFATITVISKTFPLMYSTGFCPVAADGSYLPCPDGYGAILGTACVCALLEILISFTPQRILARLCPRIVTGMVVLLIGISLVTTGIQDFMGGSGCVGAACAARNGNTKPWGSAEFLGLGFLVYIAIIFCEKWGSPIMKSCAVIVGLLTGCIVAAACSYFSSADIDAAPAATFLWVHTFKLTVYGPAVLPFLVVYIVIAQECIGDITASCDVSRLDVSGPAFDSRVQGGVLADGISGVISGLMTLTPMSTFAQNNGVIAITKCAARSVGYYCVLFLCVMGIFTKFAAALVSIPKPVLGGMTTYLFCSVAVSGLKIISTISFTRRDRIILTASLMFGFAANLQADWFSYVFTYSGSNHALSGFFDAIVLIMESGFAVSGIIGIILNLFLPQELDEELIDQIEVQQSNLAVLEAHESPQELYNVLSAKSMEAAGETSRNNDKEKDYIYVTTSSQRSSA